MKKLKIAAKDNQLSILSSVELIAGTVGQPCVFFFDDEWILLEKTISYKLGSTVLGTYKLTSDEIVIPAIVLSTAGLPLEIGITGFSNDKSLVIPTAWCQVGTIKSGASVCKNAGDNPGGGEDTDELHIIYSGGVIG